MSHLTVARWGFSWGKAPSGAVPLITPIVKPLKRFHNYDVPSNLGEVGLFLRKSPVGAIPLDYTYCETAKRFHNYDVPSNLGEVGLFLRKSPVGGNSPGLHLL
jgi:hypothetical protein